MRLNFWLLAGLLGIGRAAAIADATPSPEPSDPTDEAEDATPQDGDLLGELEVEAKPKAPLVLPKISIVPTRTFQPAGLRTILATDLDLSGEFEVVAAATEADFDDPFDPAPWLERGIEAVIRTHVARERDGRVTYSVRTYLPAVGDLPASSHAISTSANHGRLAAHELADHILGALTGTSGPFGSRIVLVRTLGQSRRVFTIDADGYGLEPVSPEGDMVVSAALDPHGNAYWAASRAHGRSLLVREGETQPIAIDPLGSIYGIAFSSREEVALSISLDGSINAWRGRIGAELKQHTRLELALSPAFTRDGRLVIAGTKGRARRIWVEARPVSPAKVSASSPTVCDHPDGPRLIYMVSTGRRSDLVSSALDGRGLTRIVEDVSRNASPSCSPDGRLVAYFSTRKGGDGPGLYLVRVDGLRPRRISAVLGDSLDWSRRPRLPTSTPETAELAPTPEAVIPSPDPSSDE